MLRIVKKIISGVLTFSMVLSVISFAPVYATTEFKNYEISDSFPQGWVADDSEDYTSIEMTEFLGEKSILISVDTKSASSSTTAKAQLYSESFKFSGKQIFSFRMAINNNETKPFRRIYLNDGENKDVLMAIKSGVLTVGGVDATLPINEFFDVLVAVDTQTQKAEVWLNNENVISTTVSLSDYVGKDVQLHFMNNFSKANIASLWYISKFERISDAEYLPVSNPEDASQIADVESLESIEVEFNTAIMNLSAATVTLEECDSGSTTYNPMEITVESDLHSLTVTPVLGFSQPKQYRLTVNHGMDVFGQTYDSYVMNFITAPDGYVSPQCTIEIERETYFVGETVNISSEIIEGSETISKAELYVNGELKRTYTDTFNFSVTAELGTNEVYVKVYDLTGGSTQSNTVTFTAVENQAPVITLNVSDGQILEPGALIKAVAEDSDGEIYKVNLRLDGKKVKEAATSNLQWTVPDDITLGKHSLEAYAVDNYGKTATKKIQVEFATYTVNEKLKVDFSTFTLDINSGSTSVGSVKAVTNSGDTVRYIKNMNIDENHPNCAVMGSDVYTGGSTKTYLELNFSESSKPKNIAIIETNMYASDTQVIAQFSLTDKNGTSCTIIDFLKGNATCKNGDTSKTMTFQAGKWYEIRAEINFNTKTYTLFINDEVYAENFTLSKDLEDITRIRIEFGNYVSGTGYVALDKFNLYDKVEFLSISEVNCLENGEEVEGDGADAVNLVLNNKVDTATTKINNVKLFAEGKELGFKDYKLNENLININLLTKLEAGYNYKFEVDYTVGGKNYKASYSFETPLGNNEGVIDSEFLVEDSNIKFSANIKTEENKTAKVIIVKYENKVVSEIQSCDVFLTSNSDNFIESPSMYFDDSDNITYKIYIWNSWTDRTAIGNKIYEFTN